VGLNVLSELESLTRLFPEGAPLVSHAEHIPSALTPEPYKSLLVHSHHMTVTMESHHHCAVDVRVLDEALQAEDYCRKIILLKSGTETVVQFGIVRLHLQFISPTVRDEIMAKKIPLGRVLINHNVLRQIDLGAILQISPGPQLQACFHCGPDDMLYGRLATIFCDGHPAIDLLEVSAPLPMKN
jgi:chorismate-pyruvate lyase